MEKYVPSQKVNIGVGKDDINDFARKYNLAIEEIYDILNKYSARKIVFYKTSDYWSTTTGGYKLSLPHNGNVVFAVYRTDSATESTQVLVGVSMDSTNVEIESAQKFSGYMLYAGLNGEIGIGYNAEDDIVEMMNIIKEATEDAETDAENFAVAANAFTKRTGDDHTTEYRSSKHYSEVATSAAETAAEDTVAATRDLLDAVLEEHSDGVMQFDHNFDIMPCQFPVGNDLWDVNADGSLTPVQNE